VKKQYSPKARFTKNGNMVRVITSQNTVPKKLMPKRMPVNKPRKANRGALPLLSPGSSRIARMKVMAKARNGGALPVYARTGAARASQMFAPLPRGRRPTRTRSPSTPSLMSPAAARANRMLKMALRRASGSTVYARTNAERAALRPEAGNRVSNEMSPGTKDRIGKMLLKYNALLLMSPAERAALRSKARVSKARAPKARAPKARAPKKGMSPGTKDRIGKMLLKMNALLLKKNVDARATASKKKSPASKKKSPASKKKSPPTSRANRAARRGNPFTNLMR
jgi:hypothetical protein